MASNNKSDNDEVTIKETSLKLDVSESTIRKYIKDFDLGKVKGMGGKGLITQEMFNALSEIVKLRANGLSIQEIKELKSQKPSKNILDEIEETQKIEKEEASETTNGNQLKDISVEVGIIEEESTGLSSEEIDKDLDKETDEEQEEISSGRTEDGEEQSRRRRGFNYRYVERQISNDSKKVSSLRIRLRNPNLTVQDRMFFEEALERRILFLNGWKHILRWISKQ